MPIPYRLNPLGITIRENLPLTLTAVEASTVTLTATGSPTVSGLHYRLGTSGMWLPYTIGTVIPLAAGEQVQFWNSADFLSTANSYVTFSLTGSLAGSGNVQSLLNWSDSVPTRGFSNLFNGCTALKTPPKLLAKKLENYCYGRMFFRSGITTPPILPAKVLAVNCYNAMLFQCFSLTAAPELPAEIGTTNCYQSMMRGCPFPSVRVGLKSLLAYSLFMAFADCFQLSRIEVNFTSWGTDATATQDWVSGVAASGTFIKPAALPEEYGPNRIPEGWTVINK